MIIRPLTTIDEFSVCRELQREAFGAPDAELITARFLVVVTHIGGAVFGAYDGDRLIAFLNTIPGIRNGAPYWHSQMLAVARDYWNSGIGTQLKYAQRDEAIKRGIRLIEWTFDPLESKNAYLNLEKLGAVVRRYYVHHYGAITSSIFHGLDSDRVVAEWWIGRDRPQVAAETRRVRIPTDLQSLKKASMDDARKVQQQVREQFLKNIQEDFYAVALERNGDESEYVFIRGAASAYPPY